MSASYSDSSANMSNIVLQRMSKFTIILQEFSFLLQNWISKGFLAAAVKVLTCLDCFQHELETVRRRQLLLIYSQDWPQGHSRGWIKVIVFNSLETFPFLLTQRSIAELLENQVLEVAQCDRMCWPVCWCVCVCVYRIFFHPFPLAL